MTGTVISLVEALKPRACNTAQEIAGRLPDAGLWAGYKADEGLVGELRLATLLTYHRPGAPKAVLVFRCPRMVGLKHVDWGHAVVLEADVEERFTQDTILKEGIGIKTTLRHEFSKTRTMWQQVTAGLEVA